MPNNQSRIMEKDFIHCAYRSYEMVKELFPIAIKETSEQS